MESSLEINSRMDALNECMAYEMPKPLASDEKRIWCRGVAKVYKVDCSRNYCVVVNDGSGKPFIVHDFGHKAGIVRVEEIYPTSYLTEYDMPVIKSKKDYMDYLVRHDEDADKVAMLLDTKNVDGSVKTEEEKERDKSEIKRLAIWHAVQDVLYSYESDMTLQAKQYEENKTKENGQEED